jgi:murein L,D-transpeptidase YcbB/YkuD
MGGNPSKGYPTLSPNNLFPIKAAIIRYTHIVARGGWTALHRLCKLQEGTTGPAVALLKQHLVATGDLQEPGGNPENFDYAVMKAVRRYQASNG